MNVTEKLVNVARHELFAGRKPDEWCPLFDQGFDCNKEKNITILSSSLIYNN